MALAAACRTRRPSSLAPEAGSEHTDTVCFDGAEGGVLSSPGRGGGEEAIAVDDRGESFPSFRCLCAGSGGNSRSDELLGRSFAVLGGYPREEVAAGAATRREAGQ